MFASSTTAANTPNHSAMIELLKKDRAYMEPVSEDSFFNIKKSIPAVDNKDEKQQAGRNGTSVKARTQQEESAQAVISNTVNAVDMTATNGNKNGNGDAPEGMSDITVKGGQNTEHTGRVGQQQLEKLQDRFERPNGTGASNKRQHGQQQQRGQQ